MGRLEGKVAIISGAAKGLGRAEAILFGQEGARLILTDVDAEGGKAVAAGIPGAQFVQHDVRDETGWQTLVADIMARHGRLDILINNAGILRIGDPATLTIDDWREMSGVNVEGVILGCKHAIPAMIQSGGGAIVNTASIGAERGLPFAAGYCASKGAVRSYTKSVAVYCAENKLNIRCNVVHPGGINTPLQDGMYAELATKAAGMRMPVAGEIPQARYADPEQIARAVLFLASDEADYVNGAEFVVDNGSLAFAGVVP